MIYHVTGDSHAVYTVHWWEHLPSITCCMVVFLAMADISWKILHHGWVVPAYMWCGNTFAQGPVGSRYPWGTLMKSCDQSYVHCVISGWSRLNYSVRSFVPDDPFPLQDRAHLFKNRGHITMSISLGRLFSRYSKYIPTW